MERKKKNLRKKIGQNFGAGLDRVTHLERSSSPKPSDNANLNFPTDQTWSFQMKVHPKLGHLKDVQRDPAGGVKFIFNWDLERRQLDQAVNN